MFKWLVNNMRRGFATNSSSSHSLVYFKNPVASDDPTVGGPGDFGWQDFTLSSLGEKLLYVLTSRIGEYGGWGSNQSARREEAVKQAVADYGHLFPEFGEEEFGYAYDGYVDHQSVGSLDKLLPLARDPHVVIYGGNDNGGTDQLDTLHRAGDAAEWGASTNSPDRQQTAEEAAAEWEEQKKWRDRW